jgi:5-methylcytosine-specific restriction enzyme subunit McrC
MPDAAGGRRRFQSLADDQVRMSALFEEFLRRFYDRELVGARVQAEIMAWDAAASTASDLANLPVMKTDITIRSPGRVMVVDAKYYPSHLVKNQFGGERLIPAHLYQLSTYLAHVSMRTPDLRLSGMLLYPQNGEPVDLNYLLLGQPVRVVTVNLADEWRDIHDRLLALAQ